MQILEQKYDQLSMHMVRPSFADSSDSSVKSTYLVKRLYTKGRIKCYIYEKWMSANSFFRQLY